MLKKILLFLLGALLAAGIVAASQDDKQNSPSKASETHQSGKSKMSTNQLTDMEKWVIEEKGTERPYTGKYWNYFEDGTYRCKKCGAKLFESKSKFESHCGWPSFDDAIPGAVKEVPDADGMRTEIVCAKCGGHLGHVFRGENYTSKNTRHCVNSLSVTFEPDEESKKAMPAKTENAYFAGGCFWGVEYYFDKEPGVISAVSGYMGGSKDSPSYQEVCTGETGHAETVRITFDPEKTSYEKLARLFFEIHDPTQVNRQGPDRGNQYRSAVFYASDEQKAIAEKLIGELRSNGFDVATKVEKAGEFYEAEDYHQDYYDHKGTLPYCHSRVKRF